MHGSEGARGRNSSCYTAKVCMKQEHDTHAFTPGPLDELVPGLRQKGERWPALPVHPRILEARREDDSHTLVMASFSAAAHARAFHAALKPLAEAALLSELSRPVEELRERSSPLRGLELYAFVDQPFDLASLVALFGLSRAPLDDAQARRTLTLLRRECQLVDGLKADEPTARFFALASSKEHTLRAGLAKVLLERAQGPFGAEPGGLAQLSCAWLAENGYPGVEPTRRGIERFEALVVNEAPFVIRWIDPIVFQALCDLIALAALTTWGREVEWGVSETDPDTRVAPPPLLRVQRDGDTFHVPLGEHILRWCVMPSRPGEEIPSLGAWAEHEFG
jgi:hypothetical protein